MMSESPETHGDAQRDGANDQAQVEQAPLAPAAEKPDVSEKPSDPAKAEGAAGPKAPEAADHEKIEISLDEVCIRLSKEGASVEMIAAFRHEMRTAKEPKLKALPSEYRQAFDTFHARPCF